MQRGSHLVFFAKPSSALETTNCRVRKRLYPMNVNTRPIQPDQPIATKLPTSHWTFTLNVQHPHTRLFLGSFPYCPTTNSPLTFSCEGFSDTSFSQFWQRLPLRGINGQ